MGGIVGMLGICPLRLHNNGDEGMGADKVDQKFRIRRYGHGDRNGTTLLEQALTLHMKLMSTRQRLS